MPTYGYQCTACDNAFEVVQKMSDDSLSICDACGGGLRKKIFPVGIAFKGSGFYVNDYSRAGGSANAETKPAESETTAAKAEAAPAATSESAPVAAAPAASATESKPAATSTPAAAAKS